MRCSRLILLIFLTLALPANCFSWPANVVSVADGDTITVLHKGQQKEVRLYGIDCPEKGQSHGQQAKTLTSALVAGRGVEVDQKDVDRHDKGCWPGKGGWPKSQRVDCSEWLCVGLSEILQREVLF